jgi:uracil-DNA glycosylase family 4
MFVGEAPGKDEDRRGVPFVGKTGMELDQHYLPLAGLRRDRVRITNAISCLPVGHAGKLDMGRAKDIDLLLSCTNHHLYSELEAAKPILIVPMGAFAVYAIDPEINLELQHGIPLETSWGTVFPMYHPARGIHEPKTMLLIRNDFVRLGKYLKGKLRIPVDNEPTPSYQVWDGNTMGLDRSDPLACDTEVTRKREPFCLTFSNVPGCANLIKADHNTTLAAFQKVLNEWTGPILWHNWLFDEDVVRRMGLHFPRHLIVDTMALAFRLGNVPQGLKALAYRELGMTMMDFDDLVTPYSTPKCLQYLRQAYDHEWPKPEEQLVRDEEGKWKLYKPQSMATKLKRFLTDYQKNPKKDVFESWDNWEDSHALIEKEMGPWPGKCITHVPFDKVLHYACRDADALLRLWPVLKRMQRALRHTVQEHWSDYEVHQVRAY